MSRHDRQLQHRQQQNIQVRASATFSGPLPPPEALAKYNDAFPGAAERIMQMAERQAAHRQELESLVVNSNVDAQKRGQRLGTLITLVVVVGGFTLMWNGRDITGLAAVLGSLAALLGALIYGRRKQKSELQEKADAFGPVSTDEPS